VVVALIGWAISRGRFGSMPRPVIDEPSVANNRPPVVPGEEITAASLGWVRFHLSKKQGYDPVAVDKLVDLLIKKLASGNPPTAQWVREYRLPLTRRSGYSRADVDGLIDQLALQFSDPPNDPEAAAPHYALAADLDGPQAHARADIVSAPRHALPPEKEDGEEVPVLETPITDTPKAEIPALETPPAEAVPLIQGFAAQDWVGQGLVGQAGVGQAGVGQAPVGQALVGQAGVGQAGVGQAPVGQAPIREPQDPARELGVNALFPDLKAFPEAIASAQTNSDSRPELIIDFVGFFTNTR
jgi:hypothetical protein